MKFQTFKLALLATACASVTLTSTVRADVEAKHIIGGIAAGLIGMALEDAQAEGAENQDEVQRQTVISGGSKLQYDQRVKEMQSDLKTLGYYDGAVDGLMGKQTLSAMQQWQEDNGDKKLHTISEMENSFHLDVLSDHADLKREQSTQIEIDYKTLLKRTGYYSGKINYEYDQETIDSIKKWQNDNGFAVSGRLDKNQENKIQNQYDYVNALYVMSMAKEKLRTCLAFDGSKHLVSYSMDGDLAENIEFGLEHLEAQIARSSECFSINENTASNIMSKSLEYYDQSAIARKLKDETLLGHRVDGAKAFEIVERCNNYSRDYFLKKSRNETASCKGIMDIQEFPVKF